MNVRTLSRSRSEAVVASNRRGRPPRESAGAIQLIEAAYGITSDAKAKQQADLTLHKQSTSYDKYNNGNESAEAKFTRLQRSMTNELFKEYQNTGCFDVMKEIWKNRNLSLHFEQKNKEVSSYFSKE